MGHRSRFPQQSAVLVPTKPSVSRAQSVIRNAPAGVIQMDETIELVDPCMVKSFQMFPDPHESTSV